MAQVKVKTKNILSLIKIKYINSSEKLNLKQLADEYGVNYQHLRNTCSREKWNKQRESIINLKSEGAYVNPEGAEEVLKILGETVLSPVLALSEMADDPSKYLMEKDIYKPGKIKEFLNCVKLAREEVQNIYHYISPTDRMRFDTYLAKMSLQYGNNSEDDESNDTFVQALRGELNNELQ